MKATEEKGFQMVGEWRDVFKDAETGEVIHDSGWVKNQVQDTNATLLAMLYRELIQASPAVDKGPTWLAIGHGLPAWDSTPPTLDQTDTTLEDEFYRQEIQPSDVGYIDPITKVASGTPTRAIEIVMTIAAPDAIGTWREFGFFGGDASATLDSGYMVNWIDHSRIDKDASMVVERTVRFTFQLI